MVAAPSLPPNPSTIPGVVRVAAYCRYSSHMQDSGYSLEAQHAAFEAEQAKAHRAAWQITWIDEPATSAHVEAVEGRPAFAAMIAQAEAGGFDVVGVHRLDRFARRLSVLTVALERLQRAGVEFVSLVEGMPYNTATGRLFLQQMGAIHEFDSSYKGERIRDGKIMRARAGLHTCRVAFGYRKVERADRPGTRGVAEPDVLEGVHDDLGRELGDWVGLQYLYGLLLTGLTDQEAAEKLNADGRWRLSTPSRQRDHDGAVAQARLFTRQSISVIRRNLFYRPYQPGDTNGTIRHAGQEYRGLHRAACTWEQWQAMQEIATGRRRGWYAKTTRRGASSAAFTAEFRGLASCAGCGGRLYVWRTRHPADNGKTRTYERYVCVAHDRNVECVCERHWARVEDVRAAWVAWVAANVRLPGDWEARVRSKLMAKARGEKGGPQSDAERQRAAETRRWSEIRARAIELYADGLKDREWMRARVSEADGMLARLAADTRGTEAHTAHLVEAGQLATSISDLWPHMTTAERVQVAAKLIEPRGLVIRPRGRGQVYSKWHSEETWHYASCELVEVRLRAPFRELLAAVQEEMGEAG